MRVVAGGAGLLELVAESPAIVRDELELMLGEQYYGDDGKEERHVPSQWNGVQVVHRLVKCDSRLFPKHDPLLDVICEFFVLALLPFFF